MMSKKHNASNFIKVEVLNNPEYVKIRNLYCQEALNLATKYKMFNSLSFLGEIITASKFNKEYDLIRIFKDNVSLYRSNISSSHDFKDDLGMLNLYNNILLEDNLTVSDIVTDHTGSLLEVLFPYYNKVIISNLQIVEAYPSKIINYRTLHSEIEKKPKSYGFESYKRYLLDEQSTVSVLGLRPEDINRQLTITERISGLRIFIDSNSGKKYPFNYVINDREAVHKLRVDIDSYTSLEKAVPDLLSKGTYVKISGVWHKYK